MKKVKISKYGYIVENLISKQGFEGKVLFSDLLFRTAYISLDNKRFKNQKLKNKLIEVIEKKASGGVTYCKPYNPKKKLKDSDFKKQGTVIGWDYGHYNEGKDIVEGRRYFDIDKKILKMYDLSNEGKLKRPNKLVLNDLITIINELIKTENDFNNLKKIKKKRLLKN